MCSARLWLLTPAFTLGSSEVALSLLGFSSFCFVFFCILLPIICPNHACMWLFLVPYIFFVFCYSRCLSRCKHCSHCDKGSKVQVSACLRTTGKPRALSPNTPPPSLHSAQSCTESDTLPDLPPTSSHRLYSCDKGKKKGRKQKEETHKLPISGKEREPLQMLQAIEE